uniref:Peptidoglycan recognition protein family domain-containing protein n=1 Tax=Strigamia maritima TaxID=126957 RepID=T1J1Y4_STRMM
MKFVILLAASLSVIVAENYCLNMIMKTRKDIFNVEEKNEIKPSAGRIFFTQTGGPTCHIYNCMDKVINLRALDISNNFTDIRDNFLIGGDGIVYEGLGWKAKNLRYNHYKNDLSVAFIGDFENKTLPEGMQLAAKNLVLCGAQSRHIDYFFSLYSEADLSCDSTTNVTNGIDESLHTLSNYARGGELVTCP